MSRVVDPVCGMEVDPVATTPRYVKDGVTWYFCCDGCRTRFAAAPHRPAPTAPHRSRDVQGGRSGSASAARYTCPMHPEVVRDGPGACPICGMALEAMVTLAATAGEQEGSAGELRDMTWRLLLGAALAVPLLLIAMAPMIPGLHAAAFGDRRLGGAIQMILATPVVFLCGWPLLARGVASLRNRRLNMFTLIAAGTIVSYLATLAAMLAPGLAGGM